VIAVLNKLCKRAPNCLSRRKATPASFMKKGNFSMEISEEKLDYKHH
jgi:hypothetical protein